LFTIQLFASKELKEYNDLSIKYHKFFKSEKTRDQWLELIKDFENHGKKYEKNKIAAKSFYNVATLSYKIYKISHRQSDLNKSLKNYEKVCINFTNSSLGDDSCVFLYKFYFKKIKNYEKTKYFANFILKNYENGDAYLSTKKFVEKNFPDLLKNKNNKNFIKKTSNDLIDIEYYKNKLIIRIKSSNNETAKIGEVKVDGELEKIFIDLKNESVIKLKPIEIDFIVEKIRFGQYKKDVGRIVFDLKKMVKYKILDRGKTLLISFKKDISNKEEIIPKEIINIEAQKSKDDDTTKKVRAQNIEPQQSKDNDTTKKVRAQNIEPQQKENGTASSTKKVRAQNIEPQQKEKKEKKYIIVIDPGHGGKDPGATSQDKKIYEKDITLEVALKLEKKLKSKKNYKIILTRRTDKALTLDQRTDIANDGKGDIFISLHINALPNKKFYGIETFYLNIAADNYSKRLESVENAENQKKISDLQFILADLLKKANTKESIDFANFVQSSLIFNLRRKYKNIKNLGVKNAMFYVLLDTKMPSILVELGFISNKNEVKKLKNAKYQEKIADSIVKGIDKFFIKYKKRK
jgi:N-acetylmuramoyl-L-alanine amidase